MATLSPAAAANIRYQEAHLSDSRVPEIVTSIDIYLPLAIGAVFLRFLSRRVGKIHKVGRLVDCGRTGQLGPLQTVICREIENV